MAVGTLDIIGTIDVGNIQFGLRQMRSALGNAATAAKTMFGDMSRLSGVLGTVAKMAGQFGTAVVGAFTSIALMSPQAAPHLARMQASMFQISTTVGEALEPSISKFADMFIGFASWLGSPQGMGVLNNVNGILEDMLEIAEELSPILSTMTEVIVGLGKVATTIGVKAVEAGAGYVKDMYTRHQEAVETGETWKQVPLVAGWEFLRWAGGALYSYVAGFEGDNTTKTVMENGGVSG